MDITATAPKFNAIKAQAAAMSDNDLAAVLADATSPYLLREYARAAQLDRGRQTVRTTVPAPMNPDLMTMTVADLNTEYNRLTGRTGERSITRRKEILNVLCESAAAHNRYRDSAQYVNNHR